MINRPTLREIAKLANVSSVTVSRALRKQTCVEKKTREKIEKIAKQIGYHPDPMLSALMAYRKGIKPPKYQGTIAFINAFKQPEVMRQNANYRLFFEGALERCKELGYQLEEFSLPMFQKHFDRLSKILYARNIQGLLLSPQDHIPSHISMLSFDWSKFSAVSFGYTLGNPHLHVVVNAQFSSARLAFRKLKSLGYRRIACTLAHRNNIGSKGNFLGGFLVEQSTLPAKERIPVFDPQTCNIEREFRKWFKCYKPEAIFDVNEYSLDYLTSSERKNCAIALHCIPELPAFYAGIHQNGRIIGRAAVEEVVSLIHSNEKGVPAIPKCVLVEGKWIDGLSAPRITQNKTP